MTAPAARFATRAAMNDPCLKMGLQKGGIPFFPDCRPAIAVTLLEMGTLGTGTFSVFGVVGA